MLENLRPTQGKKTAISLFLGACSLAVVFILAWLAALPTPISRPTGRSDTKMALISTSEAKQKTPPSPRETIHTVELPRERTIFTGGSEEAKEAIKRAVVSQPEELNLWMADGLSDADFALLGQVTSLKRLWLTGCHVRDKNLVEIAKLVNLEELDLQENELFNPNLDLLASLPWLKSLDLSNGFFLGDYQIAKLAKLPSLKRLRLEGTGLTDRGCLELKKCLKLCILDMRDTQVTDAGIAHLAGLQLQEVGLGNHVTDEGLGYLPATVVCVRIDSREVTARGMQALSHNFPYLEELCVVGPGASDDGLAWIGLMTHLRSITLIGNMGDEGLKFLSQVKDLTDLGLSGHKMTSAGMEVLKQCPRLKSAWIASNYIDDKALPIFASLQRLKRLDLNGTWVSDAGVTRLQRELPGCDVPEIRFRTGFGLAQ